MKEKPMMIQKMEQSIFMFEKSIFKLGMISIYLGFFSSLSGISFKFSRDRIIYFIRNIFLSVHPPRHCLLL